MIPNTQKTSPLAFDNFDATSISFDHMQRDEVILYLKYSYQNYQCTLIPQIEQGFFSKIRIEVLTKKLAFEA